MQMKKKIYIKNKKSYIAQTNLGGRPSSLNLASVARRDLLVALPVPYESYFIFKKLIFISTVRPDTILKNQFNFFKFKECN